MGMTGSGKTSFIKDLTGVDLEVGHDLQSCTQDIQIATMQFQGRTVHLIDTPGFDDTDVKDSDILLTIANYLGGSRAGEPAVRLSGILYLHRITDRRITGSAIRNLGMFKKLVGDKNMRSVILVTTMWGEISREDGEERLRQLTGTDRFWGGLMRCGATCQSYKARPEDAHFIVAKVISNEPIVTQLQNELHRGMKLMDTTAGQEVTQGLENLKMQHQKDIESLKRDMQDAIRERDEVAARELQEQYQQLQREQWAASEAREKLYLANLETMQGRVHALEHRICSVM
ncbi:hypothetical protein G6O67_004858 [Ophiocordyceps sinensis]|uniref:G domain-containing protein n=2 Tax=Ophiocordyceps sinensis TaxID=72228 RepID=A0A8H4V5J0_9HYPO|nr:GTP-binding domain, HSR1-related protein [Ophiocordyceps sinensis CO18]KAF4508490.1 hypothetical protein G6O67_004858 [Ophiocordyceps sinensis]